MKKKSIEELHHPNFYSKTGDPFIVRCPKCNRENWAPAVASGQCAWCGYKANKYKEEPIIKPKKKHAKKD